MLATCQIPEPVILCFRVVALTMVERFAIKSTGRPLLNQDSRQRSPCPPRRVIGYDMMALVSSTGSHKLDNNFKVTAVCLMCVVADAN